MDNQVNRMEETLPTLLQQMLIDIEDHNCHYWLYSNYFDIQQPTKREASRWYITPLFLDYDSLWNPTFEPDAILFDVILKNQLPAEKERVRIEYSQIYSVKRFYIDRSSNSPSDWELYQDSSKLRMPPIHG